MQFGIPGLDRLIAEELELPIITIAGGPGTGKSLLCLHAAAEFIRKNPGSLAVYLSTDYSFAQAHNAFKAFALDDAPAKNTAINTAYRTDFKVSGGKSAIKELRAETIENACTESDHVLYCDMQSQSIADEWNFVNAVINRFAEVGKPVLFVVDAIEGLEAFSDGMDAFGEQQSRRARVNQIVSAVKDKSASLIIVIEDEDYLTPEPEEFLTDAAIKLTTVEDGGDYAHRYIEFIKVRGHSHARGRHELKIRSKEGSSTGNVPNIDEPRVQVNGRDIPHVRVIPSLHHWNSWYASVKQSVDKSISVPPFRTPLIDELLSGHAVTTDTKTTLGWSLTLAVGDPGTGKSQIGRLFLSGGLLKDAINPAQPKVTQEGPLLTITSDLTDEKILTTQIAHHFAHRTGNDYTTDLALIRRSTLDPLVVRRIGARNLTSSGFIDIIWSHIDRFRGDHKEAPIRLVIDDWRAILETHPNLMNDAKLIPTVRDMLMARKIHALFICTQSGQPYSQKSESFIRNMREIEAHQLLLWNVPFLGERRTAITTLKERRSTHSPEIYTIQSRSLTCDALKVTRELSLYKGVEIGGKIPQKVELDLKLNEGTENRKMYAAKARRLLREICPVLDAPNDADRKYDTKATHPDIFDALPSDQTIVMEIDEYWSPEHKGLYKLNSYLTTPITDSSEEDPHHAFDKTAGRKNKRIGAFSVYAGINESNYPKKDKEPNIDRIPYYWDFGFLVLPPNICIEVENQSRLRQGEYPWNEFLKNECSAPKQTMSFGNRSLEHLACLFLEIWFSELQKKGLCATEIERVQTRNIVQSERPSLKAFFAGGADADEKKNVMFRAANLFAFAVRGLHIDGRRNITRRPGFSVAATRHYYSTLKRVRSDTVFAPLPGNFCCRGDWFLAATHGSRSWVLAERVFDVLCSKTQNLARLVDGVGLPVRDFVGDEEMKELVLFPENKMRYGQFVENGANNERHWLWRSSIKDYHRIAYYFRNWIARILITRDDWVVLKESKDFSALGNDWSQSKHFKEFDKAMRLLESTLDLNELS
jgi:KaiC/GvpD/RAD55 family RecA-like ATPase